MPANHIAFKPEVRVSAPWLAMLAEALDVLARWAPALGDDTMVVTSADDGRHGPTSLHYQGLAFDIRTHPAWDSEDVRVGQVLVTSLSSFTFMSSTIQIESAAHGRPAADASSFAGEPASADVGSWQHQNG